MEGEQLRPYRPSNGTDGDIFMQQYCYRCVKDDYDNDVYCGVLGASMAFDLDEKGYPSSTWVYFNGKPTCLAFKERGGDKDDELPPIDPDQLDMFMPLPVAQTTQ